VPAREGVYRLRHPRRVGGVRPGTPESPKSHTWGRIARQSSVAGSWGASLALLW